MLKDGVGLPALKSSLPPPSPPSCSLFFPTSATGSHLLRLEASASVSTLSFSFPFSHTTKRSSCFLQHDLPLLPPCPLLRQLYFPPSWPLTYLVAGPPQGSLPSPSPAPHTAVLPSPISQKSALIRSPPQSGSFRGSPFSTKSRPKSLAYYVTDSTILKCV